MNTEQNVLPQEPAAAVKQMIKWSERLIGIMEQEAMAVAKKDGVSFTALQEEKAKLTEACEKGSAEFGSRLQTFRSVDKALIDKLESLQKELKGKAESNSAVMERLQG